MIYISKKRSKITSYSITFWFGLLVFTVSQYYLKVSGTEIIYWEMTDFDLEMYSMTNCIRAKVIAL